MFDHALALQQVGDRPVAVARALRGLIHREIHRQVASRGGRIGPPQPLEGFVAVVPGHQRGGSEGPCVDQRIPGPAGIGLQADLVVGIPGGLHVDLLPDRCVAVRGQRHAVGERL